MVLIDYYWPVLAVSLLIGVASGILAFRSRKGR
jgi:hypothetical protein